MFKVKLVETIVQSFTMDDPKPRGVTPIEDVLWFSADGRELEFLRKQFDYVPYSLFDSCIWTGEMAGFIYRNLRTTPEGGLGRS